MNLSLTEIKMLLENDGYCWRSESVKIKTNGRYWTFRIWSYDPRRVNIFVTSEVCELDAAKQAWRRLQEGR